MTGPLKNFEPMLDERLPEIGVEKPRVTLVVTSYNYERYILQCLQSIARQTYEHFTCVVVDDCSKDKSVEIVKAFIESEEAGGRFSLIEREKNGGQMAAFKTGLAAVNTPFMVMVDADDVLLKDFLETHLYWHLCAMTVAFTCSNQYQIDENGQVISGNHDDIQCSGPYRHIHLTAVQNPFWLWATTSAMMFRTALLKLIMPEEEEPFRICADNYVVHFANLLGGSLLIPSVHGCYRRHGQNGFGANPIIGGHLPVGDMSRHPAHPVVRGAILRRLLDDYGRLMPLFGPWQYLTIIMRVAVPEDYDWIVVKYPKLFPKSSFSYRWKHKIFHYKRSWWRWKGQRALKKKAQA